MPTNFAQAMFQGMDDANQRRLQQQSMERQNRLADIALAKEERADQTDQRSQLAQLARGWKSLTDSTQKKGYYDRFIQPAVSQMGFGDLGPYDEAAVDGVASQILAAYGPGKAINPYDGLPADIQSLRLLQDNPQLAALDKERRQYSGMVPKLVETSQGIGWGTPGAGIQLAPLEGVAGQGAPSQAAPQAAELFAALGNKYGIQPTSVLRTPERNRQVGGVNNSYHLSGQAADWVVPQPLKAQFIADAKANGYEAIDEGDHVHIEPAGRGGSGGVAQPYQKPPPQSDLQQRIEQARLMGASEDDIRRMILGRDGAAAGAKPLPVGALRELLDVEDAIGAARNVSEMIAKHAGRMGQGQLVVGPSDSIGAQLRTKIGMTNANDVNLNEFNADRIRIVNESLRLNKGVQTEGDAQRAANELMTASDQATAARALRRLQEYNTRAIELQSRKRDLVRQNYGQDSAGKPAKQETQPQSPTIDDLLEKYK